MEAVEGEPVNHLQDPLRSSHQEVGRRHPNAPSLSSAVEGSRDPPVCTRVNSGDPMDRRNVVHTVVLPARSPPNTLLKNDIKAMGSWRGEVQDSDQPRGAWSMVRSAAASSVRPSEPVAVFKRPRQDSGN